MKGEFFMKKKLLSVILAGAMVLPTVVLPTSVGAEEANDSGTITVTYSPSDYVIYYGSTDSHTKRNEVAVNKQPANIRTDQDDMFSKYQIVAPDAIEKVTINIPSLPLKMKEVNVLDENGQATGEKEIVEAVMGMSMFYDTNVVKDVPADGEYYTYKETDPESGESVTKAVGGTVEEVTKIMDNWRTYTKLRKSENTNKGVQFPTLIEDIAPSTFGVTDATTKTKYYNVSKDITDVVIDDLVAAKDENGKAMFNVVYGPTIKLGIWKKGTDYYLNSGSYNWAKDSTLTVEYNKDDLVADVNAAEGVDELIAKVKTYAPMVGIDVADLRDGVLEGKLPGYVGTTFTWDSFEALLESLIPVDITQHQVDISDKFNVSNWAYADETVDADTLFIKSASSGLFFAQNANVKDTYQLKAVDVKNVTLKTTNDKGEALADPYYVADNVENGDVIDFKFDPATYHANENNVCYIWRGTSETIDGFARHTDKIYLLSVLNGNHRQTLPITVKYTDGTEEVVNVWMENRGQKQVVKGYEGYDGVHGAVFTAWPNYAGDFGTTANRIGNSGWARVEIASAETENYTSPNGLSFKKAKEGAKITSTSGGSDGGPLFWSADVDETKIIENITITSPDATLELYAVGESVISNEEMRAYIANIEKLEAVTAENAAEVLVARKYADELKMRNVAIEADFAKLNELVEDALWYSAKTDSEQIMLDISDKLNIDFMAPVGEEVESGWNGSPFSASIITEMVKSFGNSLYSNGVRTFPLKKYETALNSAGKPQTSKTETGEVVKISIPEERFEAGVRDGVYFEPKTGVTETFDATGVRAEALYIAWDFDGATQYYNVTVNYADGTSETTNVRIAGQWFTGSPQDINAYPCLASDVGFGDYNAYSAVEGADGKYTMQMTKQGSVTNGLQLYEVKLDASKVPVNYVVTSTSGYDSVIYGLTEKTMSNDDMLAVIAEAEKLEYVSTEEDAKLAKTAAAYARELDERHAVKLEDNQLVLELEEQAIAQDIAYLDLSAQADMDIIVKSGDTEKYASRDDSLLVDFDEYITAHDRNNQVDYLPDPEAGTVYKLFGGWDGKGNDAVRVAPADEGGEGVVIDLNDEMYKHISFLADSIDSAINAQTGATIYADVTYTDGETETVEITLRRGDSWYTNQQAAHYGKDFGSWNVAEGKYVNTGWVTGGNSVPEYVAAYPGRSGEGVAVFGFDIPSQKTVASVKLNAHEKAEYAIIAATATPYTNDELVANYDAFMGLEITEAEEVTGENAAIVLAGYPALKELNERHYQYAWAEDVEYYAPLYAEALKYDIEPDTLKFVPSISVENGNVTANLTMVNTTENDEDYILIIAAYDANNQLVGVKSTDQATLESMTYAGSDSVTMAVPQGAANYKALVWESKDSMDPIAIIEK